MSRRTWKPVEELRGLLQLDRVEFRIPPETADHARRFLMEEAANGHVVSADERQSNFRIHRRKRYRTLRGVAFRVIAPREQSSELQIRLAAALGCSGQDPHYYLKEHELS